MAKDSLPATIAIDGPAASGKSMLGQALAERLGYAFLDTGRMYRAFTLAAILRQVPPTDSKACAELAAAGRLRVVPGADSRVFLDNVDVTDLLREPAVEANVSAYSAIPAVREAMVALQRQLAASGKAILAGRDIGTVVLPDAPVKLYLDASPEARARRRSTQAAQGETEARRDISGRDRIDSTRPASPLAIAPGAIVIDTTGMTPDEVIAAAMEQIRCAAG
ncbi:MAG: (d)CMP kinase [Chloroflexi bacterium]|nr:(d)CMP kinase [Chloroflexota bacterium]